MPALDAFILPPRNPATARVRIGGLGLVERAILAVHRGGVERIVISSTCEIAAATLDRLVRGGVPVVVAGESLAGSLSAGRGLVVASADVVFEPAAVGALVGKLASRNLSAVAAAEASPGTLAAFTADAAKGLHGAIGDRDLLERMDAIRVASLDTTFCRPIGASGDGPGIERSCVRRTRGLAGLIVRVGRLLSLPATRACLRLRLSAS
jgi:hypothetical protein